MTNSVKLGEFQLLNRLANFYTLFYLINIISRLFELRSGSLKLALNKHWKELQKKIYGNLQNLGFMQQDQQ